MDVLSGCCVDGCDGVDEVVVILLSFGIDRDFLGLAGGAGASRWILHGMWVSLGGSGCSGWMCGGVGEVVVFLLLFRDYFCIFRLSRWFCCF